jgi:hypothetical protein
MLKMKNEFFFYEHTVNFSMSQYLEMVVIHLVTFILVGPLINLYTLIFRKSAPWLMNNLQFSRINSFGFYVQMLMFMMIALFIYQFAFTDSPVADYITLSFLVINLCLRCSSVAGKYATYPKNLYRKVKMSKISD